MDKHLTVYPISAGDELNVFSPTQICNVRIMDMTGNILIDKHGIKGRQSVIDIKHLPDATYIVDVLFDDGRIGRSVFVKT